MSNEKKPLIDSAGWGFFIVAFFVFLGPCIYGFYRVAYSDTSAFVWIGLGFLGAGTLSAIATTVANTIIQAVIERRRESEKKTAKKPRK